MKLNPHKFYEKYLIFVNLIIIIIYTHNFIQEPISQELIIKTQEFPQNLRLLTRILLQIQGLTVEIMW